MTAPAKRRRNAYLVYGVTLLLVLAEEIVGWLGGPWQTLSETVWDLGELWAGSIVILVASLAILLFHFALPHWPYRQFHDE